MSSILTEIQYLPPVSWFSLIQGYTAVSVEKFEHYQKQTYRNRCYIMTANGVVPLIIPLVHDTQKTPINEVRIDYRQKWLNNQWRTIQSAYGKAPFYEYYQQDLYDSLFVRHELLYDLNMSLLRMCFKWLRCNIKLTETSLYEKVPGTGITDYRSVLNPKKPDSCNGFYKSVEYRQVFGNKFVPNLSIIDLIFCEGPGALEVIRTSATG